MTAQLIDYCVIGAGPAALQLGYELKKAGFDFVLLEANNTIAQHLGADNTAPFSLEKHKTVAADHPKHHDRFSLLCDAPHLNFEATAQHRQGNNRAWASYLRAFAAFYQLPIRYQSEVTHIAQREGRFLVRDRSHRVILAKYVVIATTAAWRNGVFAPNCLPDSSRHHHLPELTHEWESINIPNLYFVANAAPADHNTGSAYRHSVRALARILACKNHGWDWPRQGVGRDAATLSDMIAMRLANSAALWQEASVLCDYIDLANGGTYMEAVPCRRIHQTRLGKSTDFLTIHFEIGPGNPFMGTPALVATCHAAGPVAVIRYQHNGRLLESRRLPSDPEALQTTVREFLNRHLKTLESIAM
ncbi:NAD(P)-binding domain-containing protein [Acanthopleuribacter pedis]|uniref:NAD(P)-binding domain-containing protein n=1 Tax=Acanthopleuribacter pedis TaxID=442870 RepID=A0A8J7QLL8_9BACT|nr:NAD(P)-binding domain-containing protein [Acanthopleuribacter pedis]MBO1320558.1 NAD(P)-binding domain-containing protein [Acanthopleuribacter pedis]